MDTESIETFLSEARSYKAPLVISTQYVGRLNRDVITAVFGNVGTLVCTHLGQIDAPMMQRELGDFTAEDLLDLGVGEAIVRVGSARDAFNIKVPLAPKRVSQREAIIATVRERYCRPRSEVEEILRSVREVASSEEDQKNDQESDGTHADAQPILSADQWQMLDYVIDHPDEAVTAVYSALGFSAWKGSNTRQQLRDQKLITEVETRLGKGNRRAWFLVPTTTGFQAVNKPLRSGRGGTVHRHFQEVVVRRAQRLGYQAETEHRLEGGGSVDVHLFKEENSVAVEIAIHSRPQREYKNIRKCLEAGYDHVLALFLDVDLLHETRSLFTRNAALEQRDKVTFIEVGRLDEVLKE